MENPTKEENERGTYQPIPTLHSLEHATFDFPDNTRFVISKVEQDEEDNDLVSMRGPGINAPPATEQQPVCTAGAKPMDLPDNPEMTPEMEEMIKQWKEEHKRGVVSVLWVTTTHHDRQGNVCEVWFAPNDKRNFRCKPPCAPYDVTRTYICGVYKAILEATRSEIFNKGDALAICIDNGNVINYILDEKSKDQRIRKIAQKLWEQNGSEIVFILNGIRVSSRGMMFEASIRQQASIIAQRNAQKAQNVEMRKRERATSLADINPQPQPHEYMSTDDLGKHYMQNIQPEMKREKPLAEIPLITSIKLE